MLLLSIFFILHYCPLLIPLYNAAVLINACRFLTNVANQCKPLSKFDLPAHRRGSKVKAVKRRKVQFRQGSHTLTTLIQRRHVLMITAVLHNGINSGQFVFDVAWNKLHPTPDAVYSKLHQRHNRIHQQTRMTIPPDVQHETMYDTSLCTNIPHVEEWMPVQNSSMITVLPIFLLTFYVLSYHSY